jgi:hypothetical protein
MKMMVIYSYINIELTHIGGWGVNNLQFWNLENACLVHEACGNVVDKPGAVLKVLLHSVIYIAPSTEDLVLSTQ